MTKKNPKKLRKMVTIFFLAGILMLLGEFTSDLVHDVSVLGTAFDKELGILILKVRIRDLTKTREKRLQIFF